ncbi:MAG: ATP-binding cassette domain-containing protein [bacterium]
MLELSNIKQAYKGRTVLDIASLEFEIGRRIAIVGPNGSGKTTLLSIAALLRKPDSGAVSISGNKVDWAKRDNLRNSLGYIAQEPYFFRGALLRNMELAFTGNGVSPAARRVKIDTYLSMLGLSDNVNRSPRTFSSGERKRAAIAQTLVREPSILILDEPFTFIDSASAAVLEKTILNLPEDRTVIFSTHDLSHAYRIADRTITLQAGKISPWTPENLFRLTAIRVRDGYELRTESGLSVYYPGELADGKTYGVSVNASEVFISRQAVSTSARNSYGGMIQRIERSGIRTVIATVGCGQDFPVRVSLTERAMKDLGISVGDEVRVHFKSTAIHIHD